MVMSARIYIGCAGWSLNRESWRIFGTAGSHLARYSKVLTGVEINTSFYRFHQASTYARWASEVPDDFRFSVKLFRGITHEHRLENSSDLIKQFFDGVSHLGSKCDVILVQLPPSLKFDYDVARSFFDDVRRQYSGPLALEARHISWFGKSAIDLITNSYDATVVEADPQISAVKNKASRAYIRLHGSPVMYVSNYDESYLRSLAERIRKLQHSKTHIWCVFDNTAAGHALPNAYATLQFITNELRMSA
jgi:uncharacterized protein YecE (DUF72 family)